jgi:hypothetical protein
MWITGLIRSCMMNAMSYDPIYGATFEGEQATERQNVFN